MRTDTVNVQFCGLGGQGIVLSSIIFGTAAVEGAGLNAFQTQSYGSESRGGQCQAEVILTTGTVSSPIADHVDVLIGMSQSALDRYLSRLRPGGTLIIDPEYVAQPKRHDIAVIEVPATQIAGEAGSNIAANMVMLGFIQQATGIISREDLNKAIRENVAEKFLELNLKAVDRGSALAKEHNVKVEV